MPRSGSTLLQRLIGAHSLIATVSEPWILLPLMHTLKKEGVWAEYDHQAAVSAIEDVYTFGLGGRDEYLRQIRSFALGIYEELAGGKPYFLDKTPRYHLIAKEIVDTFPEAKFIFLWRNPLGIAASMMNTWAAGRWSIYRHDIDFHIGLPNLISTYREVAGQALAVKYEDMLMDPEATLAGIFRYLDLAVEDDIIAGFTNTELRGRMGDHYGTVIYNQISREPLEKWTGAFASPLRKAWARMYLKWLGAERLSLMGYSLSHELHKLEAAATRYSFLVSDTARMTYGMYRLAQRNMCYRLLGVPRVRASVVPGAE